MFRTSRDPPGNPQRETNARLCVRTSAATPTGSPPAKPLCARYHVSPLEGGVSYRPLVGGSMEVSPHSLFLLQQLNVQREFGFLCDCTVAIGNVYFKAHRAVLAAFSNYFKMIFIHQSSECIKIQPSDIQPDIFSYLLHIMYTGMGPKQPVDPGRLQEGIRFLHAYQLCRTGGEASTDVSQGDTDAGKVSNLYGIQISSQCASKEEDPRSRSQEERLERGVEPESCETLVRVKQEKMQTQVTAVVATPPGSPGLYCHLCGERAESRQVLRQHLLSHVAASLPFSVPASVLETEPAEQRPLPEEEPAGGARKRKISCVICSRRFAHKRHLQEHMYTHTGKQAHLQRYSHLCSQLIQASQHCCQSPTNTQDNLSSCYSLDSDVSQESIDAVVVE